MSHAVSRVLSVLIAIAAVAFGCGCTTRYTYTFTRLQHEPSEVPDARAAVVSLLTEHVLRAPGSHLVGIDSVPISADERAYLISIRQTAAKLTAEKIRPYCVAVIVPRDWDSGLGLARVTGVSVDDPERPPETRWMVSPMAVMPADGESWTLSSSHGPSGTWQGPRGRHGMWQVYRAPIGRDPSLEPGRWSFTGMMGITRFYGVRVYEDLAAATTDGGGFERPIPYDDFHDRALGSCAFESEAAARAFIDALWSAFHERGAR